MNKIRREQDKNIISGSGRFVNGENKIFLKKFLEKIKLENYRLLPYERVRG